MADVNTTELGRSNESLCARDILNLTGAAYEAQKHIVLGINRLTDASWEVELEKIW